MKGFLSRVFHKKKNVQASSPSGSEEAGLQVDREIEALYGILADVLGSDKLVIKAGKMDAMRLMRSSNRGERVLALQRIILENPTIEGTPKDEEIPELLAGLSSHVADIMARRSVEEKIEKKIEMLLTFSRNL